MDIVKKISVKTVCGKVDPEKLESTGTVLFRAYGEARGLKAGESQFGPYEALIGDFAAVTPDGKSYRAPTLFLPDVALDMVKPRLEDGEIVEFAFDIVALKDKTVPVGYKYVVRPIFQPDAATDAVTRIEQKLSALPSPTKNKETKNVR